MKKDYVAADVALNRAAYELCRNGSGDEVDRCFQANVERAQQIAAAATWQLTSGDAPDCRFGHLVPWYQLKDSDAAVRRLESLKDSSEYGDAARAKLAHERARYDLCSFRKTCAMSALACAPKLEELRMRLAGSPAIPEAERVYAYFAELDRSTAPLMQRARRVYERRAQLGGRSLEEVPPELRDLNERLGYQPLPHACGPSDSRNEFDAPPSTRDPALAARLHEEWAKIIAQIKDADRTAALNDSWFELTSRLAFRSWQGVTLPEKGSRQRATK